jgi:hypothetical protein
VAAVSLGINSSVMREMNKTLHPMFAIISAELFGYFIAIYGVASGYTAFSTYESRDFITMMLSSSFGMLG